MIGVYVLGVPLIAIVLMVFAVGACIGYFWLDLPRTAKIALEVATALIFFGLIAEAFAQTTQADPNSQVNRLDYAITTLGKERASGAAVSAVSLGQLRCGR